MSESTAISDTLIFLIDTQKQGYWIIWYLFSYFKRCPVLLLVMIAPICTFFTSVQESLWYLHWHFFLVFWVLSIPVGIHPCGLTSFPRWLLMLSTCDIPPIPPYIFLGSMPIKGPLSMCEAWYLVCFFFWWLLFIVRISYDFGALVSYSIYGL